MISNTPPTTYVSVDPIHQNAKKETELIEINSISDLEQQLFDEQAD